MNLIYTVQCTVNNENQKIMNLINTVQCTTVQWTVNNENQKIMNLDPSKKSQQAWDTAIVQCKQTHFTL